MVKPWSVRHWVELELDIIGATTDDQDESCLLTQALLLRAGLRWAVSRSLFSEINSKIRLFNPHNELRRFLTAELPALRSISQ